MSNPPVTLKDVELAADRIADLIHRTPVLTCNTLNERAGLKLFLKCENFQKVGAFKFRGACNALLSMNANDLESGVITHSSGNHAQALALAAKAVGTTAFIVMPHNAPTAKRRAVEGYNGQIFDCESTLASREQVTGEMQNQLGAEFVAPFNDVDIIAGQGTAALELIEEIPDLDAIIAPVGGGGLISGVCAASRFRDRPIRVFAAEPKLADDAARSKASGEMQPACPPTTIADGLRTSLGSLTWPYVRDHVEQVFTVSEEDIIETMKLTWERAKIVIEPSAAVAIAVALSTEFAQIEGLRRVGIILSGGNLDLDQIPWMQSEG